jgi:hypothetical protein
MTTMPVVLDLRMPEGVQPNPERDALRMNIQVRSEGGDYSNAWANKLGARIVQVIVEAGCTPASIVVVITPWDRPESKH